MVVRRGEDSLIMMHEGDSQFCPGESKLSHKGRIAAACSPCAPWLGSIEASFDERMRTRVTCRSPLRRSGGTIPRSLQVSTAFCAQLRMGLMFTLVLS